ncbi:MAG: glycosyltransferase family 2 protein [bacterium]|nr:glycosyltransferase family 2 protein [bacterium]
MAELKPKLSIIVCTFNRAENLKECLESLTKQTFADFEVIIVDAGSTDKTPEIIDDYCQKLRVKKVSDNGKELAKARDLGWRTSQGELVSWIDDDVVVCENWAQSIVKTLDGNPGIAGVSGPTIVKENLLKNRDVFFFYGKKGLVGLLGKFWNYFFLERKMYEPGKLLKSGAWSPGANFSQSLEIKGLKEVDYLEACNMTLRRNLVEKAGGFDLGFQGTAEWCEIDLAQKIKKLGNKLVFNANVRVDHVISRQGAFPKRTFAKERMENFFRFYFRHIFKSRPDYIFSFTAYVIFLNFYWLAKAIQTKNLSWLSGWLGTATGFLKTRGKKT